MNSKVKMRMRESFYILTDTKLQEKLCLLLLFAKDKQCSWRLTKKSPIVDLRFIERKTIVEIRTERIPECAMSFKFSVLVKPGNFVLTHESNLELASFGYLRPSLFNSFCAGHPLISKIAH